MTTDRPKAANGVSFGLTPLIAGRIRPTPPRNSQTPMKTNKACGTAENQGTRGSIWFHTAWLKQRTFPKPVKLKKTPHNTCKVQSTLFMIASTDVARTWFCAPSGFTSFEPPHAADC